MFAPKVLCVEEKPVKSLYRLPNPRVRVAPRGPSRPGGDGSGACLPRFASARDRIAQTLGWDEEETSCGAGLALLPLHECDRRRELNAGGRLTFARWGRA
jgi:hypothetical protein